jgi:hypothetical protein
VITPAFGLVPIDIDRLAPGSYSIVLTFVSEDVFGNPSFTYSLAPFPLQVSRGTFPRWITVGSSVFDDAIGGCDVRAVSEPVKSGRCSSTPPPWARRAYGGWRRY